MVEWQSLCLYIFIPNLPHILLLKVQIIEIFKSLMYLCVGGGKWSFVPGTVLKVELLNGLVTINWQ